MEDSQKLQFHLLDGNGKPCGVYDNAILEFVKENYNLFFLAGTPYFYELGAYKTDSSGARLKTLIKSMIFPRLIRSTTITRIYQLFLMDFELEKSYEEINKFPKYWIPFKNCMVDGKTGEIHAHKPEYFCINQIPWNYEPEETCSGETTEKFFTSAMSKDDRKTIFQYLGLCMTRINFQKFIILKGSRGTGKSVVVRLFENTIGQGNFSNVPLQKLEEKFYSIQLMGKLINLCADLNGNPLKTVNTIKLITGGDSLSDSFKGRDIITFTPYARLLFSCNTVPISLDEKSNALLWNWSKGAGCSSRRQELISKAKAFITAYIEQSLLSSRIFPATGIFLLKNWANYRDSVSVEPVENNSIYPTMSKEEIAARHASYIDMQEPEKPEL